MISCKISWRTWSVLIIIILSSAGCGIFSRSTEELPQVSDPTPTPTTQGGIIPTKSSSGNPCHDLSGNIELQILVGPSEAVGLAPLTVGEIPFVVIREGDSYKVEGGGPLDAFIESHNTAWGTYTVTFDGDTMLNGECLFSDDDPVINIMVEMMADQNIEVVYEGQTMNYPWSGTRQIEVSLPILEGAQQGGEGWNLILHLDN